MTKENGQTFHLFLIRPTHYDDDGYVIQWMRSAIPSNSLATLNGLAKDGARREILGSDVRIVIHTLDETNARIRPQHIVREIRRDGGHGLVCLVGVQSNQFPRAMDLARPLRAAGVAVCIGGFHVSGCLSMLPEIPDDIREAQKIGISIFAGEAEEGRLDTVLRDAYHGELKPLYNFVADLPNLAGAVTPILSQTRVKRTAGAPSTFDAGRGCPFLCSFCTIINVQGRKSRARSAADVEHIIRENVAQGITHFFVTDDNFARNKEWEAIFDRLSELRQDDGLSVNITIQVDTLCHKIPRFIDKAKRAGVNKVFIGLENINPESLVNARKPQNLITEYRAMLQAWKSIGVITYAGYIIGFPADTPESIVRDIRIIQKELPLDMLEFFILTPLPGSEDHKTLLDKGQWMDPDMNKYDVTHPTTGHARMSTQEWEHAYRLAWETYYTVEHMETVMRRAAAYGISPGKFIFLLVWFYISISYEKVHPMESGFFRLKFRKERRPGLPIESVPAFYARYGWEILTKHLGALRLAWRLGRIRRRIKKDPEKKAYTDLALSPVNESEFETLALYTVTDTARAAVQKKRRKRFQTARVKTPDQSELSKGA